MHRRPSEFPLVYTMPTTLPIENVEYGIWIKPRKTNLWCHVHASRTSHGPIFIFMYSLYLILLFFIIISYQRLALNNNNPMIYSKHWMEWLSSAIKYIVDHIIYYNILLWT